MRTRLHVLCRVCGATGAGNHYGGLVCSCCRIFFIRHAKRTRLVPCRSTRNCVMRPAAHDNCQGCRYKKCLQAGMKPKEVGSHRERPMLSTIDDATNELIENDQPPINELPSSSIAPTLEFTPPLVPLPQSCYCTTELMALEKAFQQANGLFTLEHNARFLVAEAIANSNGYSNLLLLVPDLDGSDLIGIKQGSEGGMYSLMQPLLLLSTCFVLSVLGQIDTNDLNCTQKAAAGAANPDVYSPNAAACSNVYSDAACDTVFQDTAGTAQPPTSANTDVPRATKCWSADGAAFSQDQKDFAVATCPKLCGYCCNTAAYSCTNAPYPRINCATVTNAMCQSTEWRTVIAADCPSACGFCLLGGCIDAAPDCATQPSICVTKGLETFVAANCQRTCGLCSSSTGSSCLTAVDSNTNCANWVRNGFCTNSFYTDAQKKQYCGKSCNLC